MDKSLKVSQSIAINAPAAAVWHALTNSAKISTYLFATETITDWQPGSPITFKGEFEGKEHIDKGNVIENEAGKLLKYDYWNSFSEMEDLPQNYSIVTYTLTPVDDNTTTLTWAQEGFYDADWATEFAMYLETETLPKVKMAAEA
jgi:uncharacterized protein YndB with AHSA1/START domain